MPARDETKAWHRDQDQVVAASDHLHLLVAGQAEDNQVGLLQEAFEVLHQAIQTSEDHLLVLMADLQVVHPEA